MSKITNGRLLIKTQIVFLAELHLLEHAQTNYEYLQYYGIRQRQAAYKSPALEKFSDPEEAKGYANSSITDDLISDVFLAFSERTRQSESEDYLRTLTGT